VALILIVEDDEQVRILAEGTLLDSGYKTLSDGMQAMFVERFGYLAKPYTTEQLTTAVKNLLSQ